MSARSELALGYAVNGHGEALSDEAYITFGEDGSICVEGEGAPELGAFVVRAVNAHDDLVAALKEAKALADLARELTGCRDDDDYVAEVGQMINAALAKAQQP